MKLMRFNVTARCICGKGLVLADALSSLTRLLLRPNQHQRQLLSDLQAAWVTSVCDTKIYVKNNHNHVSQINVATDFWNLSMNVNQFYLEVPIIIPWTLLNKIDNAPPRVIDSVCVRSWRPEEYQWPDSFRGENWDFTNISLGSMRPHWVLYIWQAE